MCRDPAERDWEQHHGARGLDLDQAALARTRFQHLQPWGLEPLPATLVAASRVHLSLHRAP